MKNELQNWSLTEGGIGMEETLSPKVSEVIAALEAIRIFTGFIADRNQSAGMALGHLGRDFDVGFADVLPCQFFQLAEPHAAEDGNGKPDGATRRGGLRGFQDGASRLGGQALDLGVAGYSHRFQRVENFRLAPGSGRPVGRGVAATVGVPV